MSFVWFWTFWHWSKESFRAGALLRSPLHGIGGHWDEWFRHEASAHDRQVIERIGASNSSQRAFIAWLLRRWAREADLSGNRQARRFVLGQLAHIQPFSKWAAFENYRASYRVGGIPAIVLAEESPGQPDDVRVVEALALPADVTAPAIVADGFQAEALELETPRQAARSLLHGKGLAYLLALWIAKGRRPYPLWLKGALTLGWLAVGTLIVYLVVGPEPGENLFGLCLVLVALWPVLVLMAITVSLSQCFLAWRQGQTACVFLEQSQIRLRMSGGLTLRGGSAGLPFCLNVLSSVLRLDTNSRSWLWKHLAFQLRHAARDWTATGAIMPDGYLKPVVLEPKLRACLQREGIKHVLTPRQAGVSGQALSRSARPIPSQEETTAIPASGAVRLGFATEEKHLNIHPCRHIAQALMRLGNLTSRPQIALNLFAVTASVLMLCALPDLRAILSPAPAPMAVKPSSPSADYLWVSLDTQRPECFLVVLESRFWRNRRAEVAWRGGVNASTRAEIRLVPAISVAIKDRDDGVVWIERRPRFLGRDFVSGERVGRYDLSYLKGLGHE